MKLDATTAISLFSPGVKGAYVNKSGCCFSGEWKDIGARSKTDVVRHMVDSMHYVAKTFCPSDPLGLVRAVFSHSVANETDVNKENFKQWSVTRVSHTHHSTQPTQTLTQPLTQSLTDTNVHARATCVLTLTHITHAVACMHAGQTLLSCNSCSDNTKMLKRVLVESKF